MAADVCPHLKEVHLSRIEALETPVCLTHHTFFLRFGKEEKREAGRMKGGGWKEEGETKGKENGERGREEKRGGKREQ